MPCSGLCHGNGLYKPYHSQKAGSSWVLNCSDKGKNESIPPCTTPSTLPSDPMASGGLHPAAAARPPHLMQRLLE